MSTPAHTHAPGLFEWASLLAILVGPLVGIWITRMIDNANEDGKRRWDIFVTLQRTRGLETTPDHVGAINLIPVIFAKDAKVLSAWENLMDALNDPGWKASDMQVKIGAVSRADGRRLDLLREIASAVGAPIPAKEEHRRGYAPEAWNHETHYTSEARHLLLRVLRGEQAVRTLTGTYEIPTGGTQPGAEGT